MGGCVTPSHLFYQSHLFYHYVYYVRPSRLSAPHIIFSLSDEK